MADWYYARDHQMGPVSEERLRQMIARGDVALTDLVWTQGMADWVPAGNVPLLLPKQNAVPTHQPVTPLPSGGADPYGPQPHQQQVGYYTPDAVYAGFWLRVLAYIIDNIVLFVGMFVVFIPFSVMVGVSSASGANDELIGCVSMLLSLAIYIGYYAGMESSSLQGTVGKLVLGLRVTTLTGERISFARGVGRFFAELLSKIFLIGYVITAFTERKQSLHDLICNTVVIRYR